MPQVRPHLIQLFRNVAMQLSGQPGDHHAVSLIGLVRRIVLLLAGDMSHQRLHAHHRQAPLRAQPLHLQPPRPGRLARHRHRREPPRPGLSRRPVQRLAQPERLHPHRLTRQHPHIMINHRERLLLIGQVDPDHRAITRQHSPQLLPPRVPPAVPPRHAVTLAHRTSSLAAFGTPSPHNRTRRTSSSQLPPAEHAPPALRPITTRCEAAPRRRCQAGRSRRGAVRGCAAPGPSGCGGPARLGVWLGRGPMRSGMPAKVELIAYADRFGGDLAGLRGLLNGPLRGLFGGVHVLPFYRPYDGADAGFDPEDHTEVYERLGSWDDIAALSAEYRVMTDMIVNHVSSGSPQFQDWLAKGDASAFAGMFLSYGTAFPEGATEEALLRLYRPRPGLPFTPYLLGNGGKALLWTTFTPRQIDVDVRHPVTRGYLLRILDKLAAARVSHVRLDAIGYAVKTPGLTSFMTPDTVKFIGEVTAWCRERGLAVLVEVHSHYLHQVQIAGQVDYVYDFALPPLILHALTAADADPLLTWQGLRPANAVTVLDTHDGIGVIDVGPDATGRAGPGLLSQDQLARLVEAIHRHSGGTSRQATGA